MDRIKELLKKQIVLSQTVNAELDRLQADYQALLQNMQGQPGPQTTSQVIERVNYDLRMINTRLKAELQTKQAMIIDLELENERLRFLVSAQTSSN